MFYILQVHITLYLAVKINLKPVCSAARKKQSIVYSPVKTQFICLASVALLKIKISRFAWPFMSISFYFLLGMMYYLDCKKLQSNGKSYSIT